jgi:hypothetical protein
LAQDHVAHTTKADQAVQVDDQDPGKVKGFVDSLPSSQELQADPSVTLNPNTIPSSLDNAVAIGPQPNQDPQADSGRVLHPGTIPSDPYAVEMVCARFSKALRTLENLTDPDTAIKKFNQANVLIEGVKDQ